MLLKLEIEILGEILRVRENDLSAKWSGIYPGQTFRAHGVPFTYDELRGFGNGKHRVNAKNAAAESASDLPPIADKNPIG